MTAPATTYAALLTEMSKNDILLSYLHIKSSKEIPKRFSKVSSLLVFITIAMGMMAPLFGWMTNSVFDHQVFRANMKQ